MKFDTETKYKLGLLLSCIGGLLTVFSFNQPEGSDAKSYMITLGAILAISGLFLAIKKGDKKT